MLAGLALVLAGPAHVGDPASPEERGKRLYDKGEAADGARLTATLGQTSVLLPATRVPCASCHGPDGLGRPDAGVVPSNITWANLTKPYGLRHANGRSHPPYTVDTLIRAVTSGVDPAGNALDPAMPRYGLSDQAAHDLVAHLKRLGTHSEGGVGENEIVVAAVLPSAGPLAGVGSAVQRVLAGYFDRINRDGGIYNRRIVLKTIGFDPSSSAKGALQQLMSEAGILAVVAPLVPGEEGALAEIAEISTLPVIAPLAPYRRKAAERGAFTFHLSASLDDQARALVKYAQTSLVTADSKIAILSSDDGSSLNFAEAFRQQGRNPNWRPAVSLALSEGSSIAEIAASLRRASVSVILYDGGPARLAALAEATAWPHRRPTILTTGPAVTPQSLSRIAKVGARVLAAYPVLGSDQSHEAQKQLHLLRAAYDIPPRHPSMQAAAWVAARVLVEGLQSAGRDLTRAKLVAAIAALQNFETGLMRPISFGPSQRTGVRGAHVVPVGLGGNEKAHAWVALD